MRRATAPERGADAVLADVLALVGELGGGAAGLAICELVDPAGRVRSAETVDWRDADLAATFAVVESDVRAAAAWPRRGSAPGGVRPTSST